MPRLDIVLGLYNGARFLPEFLDSLSKQTCQGWRLIVRDDGSRDDSVPIARQWAAEHGHALEVMDDDWGNVGVVRNFSLLLARTEAPYVMLADQDDVWFPNKVADALAAICDLEQQGGGVELPAAVYTDLQVVDAELREIHPSFLAMQGLESHRHPSFAQLLVQNVAPGCTMIVNRALLSKALPIPHEAAMHDWWLMLTASALGRVGHIERASLAYRQHGGNQVGAKHGSLLGLLQQAKAGRSAYACRLQQSQAQAQALLQRLAPETSATLPALGVFSDLHHYPPIIRQFRAWKAGLRKAGALRNLAFYALM
ncbi:MAG: glycosyltransferase family 2 protein [Burkholderiaceae bacterium]|nr:glycosyltransferase family 2 protein [Burkholderiaceae bacterium]